MRNPLASPLWTNRAFVRVWSAATISVFGTLITRVALPFAAIIVLGSGAVEVAVLRGLELGAMLLVGLVAGAWVDRLRRRPVLIWADLGRAALLASKKEVSTAASPETISRCQKVSAPIT